MESGGGIPPPQRTAVVMGVVAAASATLALVVTSPYRAEGQFATGLRWRTTSASLATRDPGAARQPLLRARQQFLGARRLNPLEAGYALALARTDVSLATSEVRNADGRARRRALWEEAVRMFTRAAELNAGSASTLNEHAALLAAVEMNEPSTREFAGPKAVALRQRGLESNPWLPASYLELALLLESRQEAVGARAVLEHGLRRAPGHPDLLRAAARAAGRAGDLSRAGELWIRLRTVAPGDPEAIQAAKGPAFG